MKGIRNKNHGNDYAMTILMMTRNNYDDDGDDNDDGEKDDDDPDDRDCQGGRLLPEAPAAETGDRFSRSLRPSREARRGKIAICNKAAKNCVVPNYFCLNETFGK